MLPFRSMQDSTFSEPIYTTGTDSFPDGLKARTLEDTMTVAWPVFSCLTCAALTLLSPGEAGRLPPPTNLSHKWLDPFIVNVSWSWEQPRNLPKDCKISFEIHRAGKKLNEYVKWTEWTHFTNSCLTEEMDSDHWDYTIQTISVPSCDGWNNSLSVITTVHTAKPRAEVAKDFKCILDPNGMNCSWIPVNRSLNLMLSYRKCGESKEVRKKLRECDRYYRHGMRDGCYLHVGDDNSPTCINAQTEAALSTFKPLLVVPSPKLTITQKEDYLYLSCTRPKVGVDCDWTYEYCFKKCYENEICKPIVVQSGKMRERYDEGCLYEFRCRVSTGPYCPRISSDFSEIKTHGANKPPDKKLTVVAIIIPTILSLCVILSCFCCRRHRDILCPTIPDPSTIFKEMMMNGSKDVKTTDGKLYKPVQESTDPCKIENENSVTQQKS
ncbi:hypothetical protein Q5P01_002227 [Channa striata]|uniref:Uncharacterized protein n=1 Tax=Channa striata TaxID=64152 RepID=A0AA88NQZ4_CHASR|nr:hypothetical protein Q5P01_002227 [Channa striata]